MLSFSPRHPLAAIVLAAFAVSAHAQSNVTVYGVVDLGFAKTNGKTLIERENHASRLGFRGVEDLGNGLSAIFNLESEILADTGAQKGVLFERQANVGLKGAFGTAILGRTKNIVDGAQGRVEPFGVDGVVGKVDEALMRVGVSSSRVSNALTYGTPKLIKGMLVGLNYTIGSGDAHAVVARQTQSNNVFDNKETVKEYGVGYDHHLSKRTDLYAYAGREQVTKLTPYQMGISHKF